jgi:hypothetical protein
MEKHRWARFLCTTAVVLGFHVAVIWLILTTSRVFLVREQSQNLEIVRITQPLVPPNGNPQGRASDNAVPRHRSAPDSKIASPKDESDAIQPPADWAGEIRRAANDMAAKELMPKPKDFGFPHSSSAPDRPIQFGWDYAATHRVESLPEGGLLIHLSDNCVLVLFPLPFAGCGIGKRKANGDLFEHMRDPVQPGDPSNPM